MDFYDLDLSDGVLDALDDMRFTETTPIQEDFCPVLYHQERRFRHRPFAGPADYAAAQRRHRPGEERREWDRVPDGFPVGSASQTVKTVKPQV